jgi:hypothetical protein
LVVEFIDDTINRLKLATMRVTKLALCLLTTASLLAACDEEGHLLFKHFVEAEQGRPTPPEYRQQVADCFYDAANSQMSSEGYAVLVAYLTEIGTRQDRTNLRRLSIAKQIKYMAYGQIAMDLYLGCRSELVPQTALNEVCQGKDDCRAG